MASPCLCWLVHVHGPVGISISISTAFYSLLLCPESQNCSKIITRVFSAFTNVTSFIPSSGAAGRARQCPSWVAGGWLVAPGGVRL